MDLTHWILGGMVTIVFVTLVWGWIAMARILRKDEAIDAATFLALRELRERFERGK